jgi:hypothetical protein
VGSSNHLGEFGPNFSKGVDVMKYGITQAILKKREERKGKEKSAYKESEGPDGL